MVHKKIGKFAKKHVATAAKLGAIVATGGVSGLAAYGAKKGLGLLAGGNNVAQPLPPGGGVLLDMPQIGPQRQMNVQMAPPPSQSPALSSWQESDWQGPLPETGSDWQGPALPDTSTSQNGLPGEAGEDMNIPKGYYVNDRGELKKRRYRRRKLLTCGDKADIAFIVGQVGTGAMGKAAVSALLSRRCG